MTKQRFGYVYGGAVTFGGQRRELDGMAWADGRCDEVRLRAAAVRDLSRTEGIPLAGIEIKDFWFSEIVTDADTGPDPFRPHDVPDPCGGDT